MIYKAGSKAPDGAVNPPEYDEDELSQEEKEIKRDYKVQKQIDDAEIYGY